MPSFSTAAAAPTSAAPSGAMIPVTPGLACRMFRPAVSDCDGLDCPYWVVTIFIFGYVLVM